MGGDSERASTLRVDTAPPAIQSIAAPKGQTYGEGGTIAFRVNFTEPVIATGVPALPITVGDTVREAVWNGRGSGSKSLTFTLPVRAGDSAPTGVRVAGPIVLSGGAAIRDKAGNDLTPAASGEFPRARVDAVGPSVSDFGQIAIAGKRVSMRVTFTEPVTVRGKPSISFALDGAPRRLVYARGAGSDVLVFYYIATRRETLSVETVTASEPVIVLGSGRIIDRAGNFATSLTQPTGVSLAFEMAFVTVGDAGNEPDRHGGWGAVNYQYQIGTYEVTIGQYTAFLNAVAQSDPNSLYNANMASDLNIAGISRSGTEGSYTYSVIAPAGLTPAGADSPGNRPITYVSWFDAARFANWMHNGQGSGSTETGAYTISTGVITSASRNRNVNTYTLSAPSTLSVGDQVRVTGLSAPGFNIPGIVTSVSGSQFTMDYVGFDAYAAGTGTMTGASPTASVGALYRLPTENEWYKAAYYSPNLNSGSGGYYTYATQSNMAPGNTIGDGENQANYDAGDYTVTQSSTYSSSQNYLTNVGAFTNSASYYGTYDQSGNAFEWSEVIVSGSRRGLLGGDWNNIAVYLSSSGPRNSNDPLNGAIGFRLASPG